MSHLATTSPFLPLPDGIVIASVHPTASHLVVQVACCSPSAACPLCQQPSERVHGAYVRTIADLPCEGPRVILSLRVRKFVQDEEYPERHQCKEGASSSLLDPYKGYILQRWQQGCRNSVQLYDEITARGFKGSAPLLRKFLAELRKKHQQAGSASVLTLDASRQAIELSADLPPLPRIACRMSATRASWLFVSQAGKLDEKQTQHVGQIRAGHPDLERGYQLSQEFVMMLAERRVADLDPWLTQAEHSRLPEFKKMAKASARITRRSKRRFRACGAMVRSKRRSTD